MTEAARPADKPGPACCSPENLGRDLRCGQNLPIESRSQGREPCDGRAVEPRSSGAAEDQLLDDDAGGKTGRERTTPVNLVEADDGRWLVSPYGDVGWVHNLRANGALQLRRGRARESIVAEEVGPAEAGPILQRYVRQVGVTAPFFEARRTDPVENFVAEAGRHPVFRLKSASESA